MTLPLAIFFHRTSIIHVNPKMKHTLFGIDIGLLALAIIFILASVNSHSLPFSENLKKAKHIATIAKAYILIFILSYSVMFFLLICFELKHGQNKKNHLKIAF